MVTPSTSSAQDLGAARPNANRNAQRVVSPSMVIGLGSTSCQIVRQLESTSEGWSLEDRKNLAFLYMDTREATRGEISRTARFIPLILPHFSSLRDMRPWITECVPELRHLSLSREGALGTFANAGVAARFNYSDIRGYLDSAIDEICPFYEGSTYMRVHIVAFAGGGTVGALPVLLAALSEVRGTARNFSVVLHLLLPQRGMSRDPDNTYQLQLRNAYVILQFLRSVTGVQVGRGEHTGSDTFSITVYPDKRVEAIGPHFDVCLLHRSPRDSLPVQRNHTARTLESLVADAWGTGQDWWARFHETMREANSQADAKFGSISSRETGLIEGFFTQTAKQYLHNQWRSRL
ncbi:MAG: hypothetical protein F4X66_03195 [Chloroflexi bacterium]|nr:hypothetical protein [Chloroflexota bacterium]MYE39297.1 hypothetical protein [Chloroflexota bacterium]